MVIAALGSVKNVLTLEVRFPNTILVFQEVRIDQDNKRKFHKFLFVNMLIIFYQ